MKIKRLVDSIITSAIADVYTDTKTDNKYYNLVHGVRGADTWQWRAGLTPEHFPMGDSSVVLDSDNYNIAPIYVRGKLLKDRRGNTCYNIVKDNDPTQHNDIILLWSIPCRLHSAVTYEYHGAVSLVGEGILGKSRGNTSTVYPAPILEICGDCVLSWYGVNCDKKNIKQTITYEYTSANWKIGVVEILGDADV